MENDELESERAYTILNGTIHAMAMASLRIIRLRCHTAIFQTPGVRTLATINLQLTYKRQ